MRDLSATVDTRTTQAISMTIGLVGLIVVSIAIFVVLGLERYSDGYLLYVIGGTPVIGLAGSIAMISTKRWSALAALSFFSAAIALALAHYLIWVSLAPTA